MSTYENEELQIEVDPTEPWLGVHTLSEFAFCPCAGICTHDQAGSDDGEEFNDRPGFYHMPIFVREELERKRADVVNSCMLVMLLGLIVVLGTMAVGFFLDPVFHIAAMLCGLLTLAMFISLGIQSSRITQTLKQWEKANSEIPNSQITEPTKVHWPNFSVADFKLQTRESTLEDTAWKLRGKPWRVLVRGNEVIPVFLRNVTDTSAAKVGNEEVPYLHDQHFVRIAAYCHLIEKSEEMRVPYGIIVTRGSLTGIAIPNNEATRKKLLQGLENARETMRFVAQHRQTRPVHDEKLCVGCPHGKPVPLTIEFSEMPTDVEAGAKTLAPCPICAELPGEKQREPRKYHSHCGDRFGPGWIPPHEDVTRLRLTWEKH